MDLNRIVDSESTLKAISTLPHEEGEVVFCSDTNKVYIWKEGKFVELTLDCQTGEGLSISMYELNQQIVSQLPDMNNDDLYELRNELNKFHKQKRGTYYMMLCAERSYYTVFVAHTGFLDAIDNTFGHEVLDCMSHVGDMKTYVINEDDIELWFTDGNGTECMHLFPYDAGIVDFWEGM